MEAVTIVRGEGEGVKQAALVGADAGVVIVGVEVGEVAVEGYRVCRGLPREALGEHGAEVLLPCKL